jgi:fructose/tagatose bisphosphate aldolase
MARWDRDLKNQMRTMMEPVHNHPLVLHGGSPVGGVPSYVINPPPTGSP